MKALISLCLFASLSACVDPDKFEAVDAEVDAAQDTARPPPPPPDAFLPPPDAFVPPADAAGDGLVGDAAGDAADGDAAADAAPDAAPDVALAPDVAPPPERCDVEFDVTLPGGTPAGEIHVAGTFYEDEDRDWMPGDPALRLTRAGDRASGTFSVRNGARLEYKYTRGSWEAGESAADCGEIPNRSARVACTDGPFRVVDVVVAWRDACQ